MRNLKKILALVLALVMSFSVMSLASADFKDADKITATYGEAVDVLSALGVFQGDDKGNFNPQGSITRAEVAAIIYRIDTGDVNADQVKIYADYNKFNDVDKNAWYAGYVNYCANAQYIKGYDESTFGPNDKVTGYQALAMILRAVGYDQNNEFSGSAWQIEVAKYANKLGITANVNANTLGVAASRELIAELLFRTITEVPQVTYTLALGYNQYQSTLINENSKLNPTIGEEMFALGVTGRCIVDAWGRPGYYWYQHVEDLDYAIVVYPETPVNTYTVATTECEIAVDLLYKGKNDIVTTVWTNGVEGKIAINPVHEHVNVKGHLVGGQGTILETYEGNPYTDADDSIVMIETYLAYVSDTVKQVTDKAGHVKVPATNELTIFGGADEDASWTYTMKGNNYATGDFLLVYYHEVAEAAVVVDYATTLTAAQTTIWWNAEKHSLDKVDYNDNENFSLDDAKYDTNSNYVWFLDQYNNVIGNVAISTPKTYAIVTGAQWINGIGTYGYAQASLRYLDGTEETVKIAYIDDNEVKYANTINDLYTFEDGYVYTTWQYNTDTNKHLYLVEDMGNGYYALTQVAAHYENATFEDGVSRVNYTNLPGIDTDNGSFLTDNFTQYIIFDVTMNYGAGGYIDVVGYDNLPADYEAYYVDVLYDARGFASVVYMIGAPIDNTKPAYEFIYFTGDMMNFYETAKTFALYGVVDAQGNLDPLYFSQTMYGTKAQTKAMLMELMHQYQDTLCLVTTKYGVVVDITPVNFVTGLDATAYKLDKALYADSFLFTDESGVLVANGMALNVNNITTIINDGEIGSVVDLTEAALEGKAVYVIHKGTWAKTVFITDATPAALPVMLRSLTAADFADVAGKTYETVEAAKEAIENSASVSFLKELYGLYTIVNVDAEGNVELFMSFSPIDDVDPMMTIVHVVTFTVTIA